MELFRETLRLEPDRADGLYGLGPALADQGDFAGAEHALRKAVQTEHRMPFAHQRLGMALAAPGRGRESMAVLVTAQAQKPDLPEIAAQIEQACKALACPTPLCVRYGLSSQPDSTTSALGAVFAFGQGPPSRAFRSFTGPDLERALRVDSG